MSLVDLGKRLLEAARNGHDDEVRTLMANGAPFTTDWVGYMSSMSCLSFCVICPHCQVCERYMTTHDFM